MIQAMMDCYNQNDIFKQFVDKRIKDSGKDIDTVMQEVITQQYYEYINKIGEYDAAETKRIRILLKMPEEVEK